MIKYSNKTDINHNYEDLISQGIDQIKKNRINQAIIIFKKIIEKEKLKHEAYINLSNCLILTNEVDKAIKLLENYLKKYKYNENIANHIGKICINYNLKKNFFKIFDFLETKKNKIRDDLYFIYYTKGHFLQKEKKYKEAIKAFENSIKCNNNYFDAFLKLFRLTETTNNIDDLERYLNVAKELFTEIKEVKYILFFKSLFLNRKNSFKLSENIIVNNDLSNKFKNNNEYLVRILDLQSKNNERLKKYNDAFKYVENRNNILINQNENQMLTKDDLIDTIDKYKIFFNKKNFNKISKIGDSYIEDKKLIFLIGFPRSGTTLLDTILRTHSKITVLEEKPYILEARHNFFNKNNNNLNTFLEITNKEKKQIRKNYFNKINKEGIARSNIIIDKFPLSIIEIGFIKSIFPNSKLILALRHPCDVVISCYFSLFTVNEAMINFLNWEDTINFYKKVFSLYEFYEKELNLEVHKIKYEELISDFKSQVNSILNFLELNYENALENYHITAKKREKIFTPSYSQVINPLYKTSIDRWKKYIDKVDPRNELDRWIKKFNY